MKIIKEKIKKYIAKTIFGIILAIILYYKYKQ